MFQNETLESCFLKAQNETSIHTISIPSHPTPKEGLGIHKVRVQIQALSQFRKPTYALFSLFGQLHQCNPSLSLLLAGPASQLWCDCVFSVPKSYSAHQMRLQASLFPNGQLLSISTGGSFLSQMDRTRLVYQLFPLTYLFSFVRPAVRIHPLI